MMIGVIERNEKSLAEQKKELAEKFAAFEYLFTTSGKVRFMFNPDDTALRFAERYGIIEYEVKDAVMEWWSLYSEGFYFVRHDLITDKEERELKYPWKGKNHIPKKLLTPDGYCKYNYMVG